MSNLYANPFNFPLSLSLYLTRSSFAIIKRIAHYVYAMGI